MPAAFLITAVCSLVLPSAVHGRRHREGEILDAHQSSQEGPVTVKEWDSDGVPWKDSNVAGIGSDEDKALRKRRALAEPAWEGQGTTPGVVVWRIEKMKVVPWPTDEYGHFFEGDSYIVLKTEETEADGDEASHFVHDIFFWLGKKTSIDERGVAAIKTVELDDFFDGEPAQHREVQGHESAEFKELFDNKLEYRKGGVNSGFRKVMPPAFKPTLYKYIANAKKTKEDGAKGPTAIREKADDGALSAHLESVALSAKSLADSDFFFLDHGDTVYFWSGPKAPMKQKYTAHIEAKKLAARDTKNLEMVDGAKENARFVQLLGSICPATDGDKALFELSDASGHLVCTKVPVSPESLNSDAVMLADSGSQVFVWEGAGASSRERQGGMRKALDYLQMNRLSADTPISVIKEGQRATKAWHELFA